MNSPEGKELNEDCNKNIIEVSNRIRDGNQRIQQPAQKGILLLGNTGSGKSTLAHAIIGRKLQSVMDEITFEFRIDSVDPLDDIVIGHYSCSETKIPNRCSAGNVIIWDCPGYDDTDPVQEIPNRFYIKRLFEITHMLKFLLVVPESELKLRYGSDFLDTVSNFMQMFENVQCVMDSISLVVTKVTQHKTVQHIQKAIQSILTSNPQVTSMHVELINKMLPSLYLFHEPEEAGETIELPGLLESIDSSGKYTVVNEKMVTVNISKAGKELSSRLLEAAWNNFYFIIETIVEAIFDATNCITVNDKNSFSTNHHIIKEWVPNSVDFNTQQEQKKGYFLQLELLTKLLSVIPDDQISDPSEVIRTFQNVLQVFCEFALDTGRHLQMQDYGYCLQQQYEYKKFFSAVCETELLDCAQFSNLLKECHKETKDNLHYAVVNLDIDEYITDEDYYHRGIMFLKNYEDSEECMKHLAVAYKCLGVITAQNDAPTALIYFIKSVKANKEQPEIYEKLGKLLTKFRQYSQAIECYNVINNVFMIKSCYKKWLREKKNSPEIMMDRAAYCESIGQLEEARKYYAYASGLSKDKDLKSVALKKWGGNMIDTAKLGESLVERAGKNSFYNFSTVDETFIENLLNKVDLTRNENYLIYSAKLSQMKHAGTKNLMAEISKLWKTMSSTEKHKYANKWKYMNMQKFLNEIEKESNSDVELSDDDNNLEKFDGDDENDDDDYDGDDDDYDDDDDDDDISGDNDDDNMNDDDDDNSEEKVDDYIKDADHDNSEKKVDDNIKDADDDNSEEKDDDNKNDDDDKDDADYLIDEDNSTSSSDSYKACESGSDNECNSSVFFSICGSEFEEEKYSQPKL